MRFVFTHIKHVIALIKNQKKFTLSMPINNNANATRKLCACTRMYVNI